MTLEEIKAALLDNKTVFWKNAAYRVIQGKIIKGTMHYEYLIHCTLNDNYIGLTWADNVTLNGKEEDFFIKED